MKTTFLQSFLILFILFCSITSSFGVAVYPAVGIAANFSDAPATPETIKGPVTVCPGQTVSYSTDQIANALSYTWTIPNSWMITAGQGTRQISVVVGANAGAISVQAMNNYGASGSRQLQVTIARVPSQPDAIEGPASLCGAGKATYRVQPIIEGMAYSWTLPAGWAIVSGQGTGEIEVEATAGKGTISVTAGNMCGQSMPTTLAVAVTPAIMNNLLPASQAVCEGEAAGILAGSVPTGGDGTYTYLWESSMTSATEGFVPATGANSNQNYTPGLLKETTWFRRKVGSATCEHTSEALKIEVLPIPDKPVIEQAGDMELRSTMAGEYYEWLLNGVLLQTHTQSILVEEEGSYKVRVRNAAGCFSPYSDALEFLITGLAEEALKSGINIYLNQRSGKLAITTQEPLQQVELQMVNLQGQVVFRKHVHQIQAQLELELEHLPNGVYLLYLKATSRQFKRKILLHQ